MNMITELLLSKHEVNVYDLILVVVNQYTKMTKYIFIIKKLNAVKLADTFFKQIVYWYETSKEVVSDRDFIFTSNYWSEICHQTKIKCWLSTVFYS